MGRREGRVRSDGGERWGGGSSDLWYVLVYCLCCVVYPSRLYQSKVYRVSQCRVVYLSRCAA